MIANLSTLSSQAAESGLAPISEDEAMFSYLSSSEESLSPDIRRKLNAISDKKSYGDKLICREVCRSLGIHRHFSSRNWYRAALKPNQLKYVRLGHESSNNFSRYFSRSTYRVDIAAANIQRWAELTGKQRAHREKVIRFSESIETEDLQDVMLCASKYTINRRLKVFDGNHRIIAYVVRNQRLLPFTCIVGFSKPLILTLLQRGLLAFPCISETKCALRFSARTNFRRIKGLLRGGVDYQPQLRNGDEMRQVATMSGDKSDEAFNLIGRTERPCADRAWLIRDDMRPIVGHLDGATVLDIGCNVGFFCHFFASLGMKATGVENSQHNKYQRFSVRDSVQTANRMNHRYNLTCEFISDDALSWVKEQKDSFDVVLLLSVIHHFFMGYPIGDYEHDPLEEARRFIANVARITRKVLYIEHEDADSGVSAWELVEFLSAQNLFKSVSIVGYSDDFHRPIIRCQKH